MPGNGTAASYGDLLVMSLVVLGGVCVAAFVIVRLVGRVLATGRARGAHLLDVVARVPLEPRRSLYVVEVAGKTLLVGTSEMGLSVLSELDGAEVRARVVERPSFAELVRAAWSRRRGLRREVPEGGEERGGGGAAAAKEAPRDAAGGGGGGGATARGEGDGAVAKEAPRDAAGGGGEGGGAEAGGRAP
jgi:flagellar biogenesis protein FliO